jgi:hypothetical protein
LAWLHEVVKPAIDDYLKQHPDLSPGDVISKLFKNQSQLRAAANYMYDENYQTLQNEISNRNKSLPLQQQHDQFINKNPYGIEAAYEKQKEAMLSAIGAPIMQAALPIMQHLTSMFTAIGEFATAHPDAIKNIAYGLGILAAALAGFAVAALVSIGVAFAGMVGTVGLVAAGVTALASGIAALVLINWDSISAGLSKLAGILATLGNVLKGWQPPAPSSPGESKPETPRSWMWKPSSFVPPPQKPEVQRNVTAINIDGAQLAKYIDERLAVMHALPDSASTANGVAYENLNDWNSRDS